LTDVLIAALTDQQARRERGAAAQALVQRRFTWSQVATAVTQAYAAAEDRRRRPFSSGGR
jgi:hypothetical protein